MKNMAVLALIVGFLGSNTAVAEGSFSDEPTMILAFNSTTADQRWATPSRAVNVDTDAINKKVELELSKSLEIMSLALDKQLEDKLAQEFVYDVQ